jgi:hypothetical protein
MFRNRHTFVKVSPGAKTVSSGTVMSSTKTKRLQSSGMGVFVGIKVFVAVGVGDDVSVGVFVGVEVGVLDAVCVTVADQFGVLDGVLVDVFDGIAVRVLLGV